MAWSDSCCTGNNNEDHYPILGRDSKGLKVDMFLSIVSSELACEKLLSASSIVPNKSRMCKSSFTEPNFSIFYELQTGRTVFVVRNKIAA